MLNNLGKTLAGFCLVCSCPAALLQPAGIVDHGTIVLILHKNDRILVAADSKLSGGGRDAPRFNECKIPPLGQWVFFTAVGNAEMGDLKDGKPFVIYKARELSEESFARFRKEPNTNSRTKKMADYWGQTVRNQISAYIAARHWVPTYRTEQGPEVLKGIFASNTPPSNWAIYEVRISADRPKSQEVLQTITYHVDPKSIPPNLKLALNGEYRGLVGEFVSVQTPRSIAANKKMLTIIQSNPTIDADAFGLEFTVSSVEEWAGPHSDIGGDVDVLELNSTGVHWLKVKEGCRYPKRRGCSRKKTD